MSRRGWQIACFVALLIALNLAVYRSVGSAGFVSLDDKLAVADNPHVQRGLNAPDLAWAFTTFHTHLWIPLTWVSYMLDTQLLGAGPAGHHLVNLALHLVNSALLFWVLLRATGAPGRSGLATLFFAAHPLRVESVAWITERKDVLSTAFFLLAIAAYLAYVRRRRPGWYAVLALLFALGSMAKPMVVTLPFALLLLDFWPLNRLGGAGGERAAIVRAVAEKLPLLALSASFSLVTYRAVWGGGPTPAAADFPLGVRAANAALSYVGYLGKTFFPKGLAVLYPHPGFGVRVPPAVAAALALLLLTALLVWLRARHPFLPAGWLWYLGTLVPVIGVVQAGPYAMADRFTYIPSIGLSVATCWGAAAACAGRRRLEAALGVAGAAALCLFAAGSAKQAGYWRDPVALFEHALAATGDNWVARHSLGTQLLERGDVDAAIGHLRAAAALGPATASVHNDLGSAYLRRGRVDEAVAEHRQAVAEDPGSALFHGNLGVDLMVAGRPAEAIEAFRRAVSLDPRDPVNHENLGDALISAGRPADAAAHVDDALRLDPGSARARAAKGRLLEMLGGGGGTARGGAPAVWPR